MIEIKDKKTCCGCTACMSICPKKCIEMKQDEEGFYYPYVNKDKCIDCGLCEKVCPFIHTPNGKKEPKSYIIRTRDEDVLKESTSGGAFSPLADYIIQQSGIVFGAEFDNEFKVIHGMTDTREGLVKFRGSKYVQSDMRNSYISVKKYLLEGKKVLFSGTPCQIGGLKNYLGKDYEDLFCVDVVCKGVASPKVWEEYKKYQCKKFGGKIIDVKFRKKKYGYHSSAMNIHFDNGKEYSGSGRVDYMLKSYYKELCSRPSCYNCKFKTEKRVSDITIFDGWHYSELAQGKKDDDKGYTIMLIHSPKGETLFEQIKNMIDYVAIDIDRAISLDGVMVKNNAHKNEKRECFFSLLEKSIKMAIQKTEKVTIIDLAFEKIKFLLYKTGILKILKRIKSKMK